MTWEHALAEYIRFLSLSVQYYFLEPKQGVVGAFQVYHRLIFFFRLSVPSR